MKMTDEKKPKSIDYGFPSHFISPSDKDKKWCLQYIKAFNKEYTTGRGRIFRWANDEYATWRAYANGKQPIDQYKELLGVRKRKGKRDLSWMNLDWNILSVMPRMKAVVKNKILNEPYEIIIKPIDQVSVTEERKRRSEIVEFIANKDFLSEVTANLPVEPASPFEEGEPQPANMKEVDLYMDVFPKNRHAMEMMDQIMQAKNVNDWKQVREEFTDDLFDVGVGGTKTWIDNIGNIKIRRCIPERMITNSVSKNDFKDIIRVGEYVDITISELRQRVPRGTFTEKEYMDIAIKASGNNYSMIGAQEFFSKNSRYAWDHERITVLDCEWFSADDLAYVVDKEPSGRLKIIKKDDPTWLAKQGIKDIDYIEFQKKQGKERDLIRDSVNNVYKGSWIVGTDYIYDFGLQSNMIRSISSMGDCELGYTLYTLNFDSIIRQTMPLLDDIQKNWLLYQHYTAAAKPPGVAIERRAITQVSIGSGKNAILLSPEDILKQYAETGSYIYVGTDAQGKPYPFDPIKELKGGISEQAFSCYNNIIKDVDLIRNVIGLNEFTDASSPDPRANKDIVMEAVGNTNNALGTFLHAYISIEERTAKKICMLVPDAENMGYNKGKIEALGDQTHDWFKSNADLPFIDWSLTVELGITKEMRATLRGFIQQSLKGANNPGGILPEDAWIIDKEPNIDRAYMILAQKRRQREQEAFQQKQALMQQQSDGNTQSALAIEQAKQQGLGEQLQMQAALKTQEIQGNIALEREKGLIQAFLIKLGKGLDLSAQEAELYNSLIEKQISSMTEINKARINAETKKKNEAKKAA